jgi:hypothetical protein
MDYTGDQYTYDDYYHHPDGILRPRKIITPESQQLDALAIPRRFPASCDRPGGFPVPQPGLRIGRVGDQMLPGIQPPTERFSAAGSISNHDLLFLVIVLFVCMCFGSCVLLIEIKKLSASLAAIQSKV